MRLLSVNTAIVIAEHDFRIAKKNAVENLRALYGKIRRLPNSELRRAVRSIHVIHFSGPCVHIKRNRADHQTRVQRSANYF